MSYYGNDAKASLIDSLRCWGDPGWYWHLASQPVTTLVIWQVWRRLSFVRVASWLVGCWVWGKQRSKKGWGILSVMIVGLVAVRTKRRGVLVNARASYSGGPGFESRNRNQQSLTENSFVIFLSASEERWKITYRPRPPPPVPFRHSSFIINL